MTTISSYESRMKHSETERVRLISEAKKETERIVRDSLTQELNKLETQSRLEMSRLESRMGDLRDQLSARDN